MPFGPVYQAKCKVNPCLRLFGKISRYKGYRSSSTLRPVLIHLRSLPLTSHPLLRAYATDRQVDLFAQSLVHRGAKASRLEQGGFCASRAIERVMCSSELWEMPRLQSEFAMRKNAGRIELSFVHSLHSRNLSPHQGVDASRYASAVRHQRYLYLPDAYSCRISEPQFA